MDVKEIVDFSSCDLMFKRAPRINEYRCWVLRYAKKGNRDEPSYLYTVESPHEGMNLQSRGHAKYLEKFGLKMDLKNPFGTEEIEVQDYNTRKRTDLETEKEDTEGGDALARKVDIEKWEEKEAEDQKEAINQCPST